MSEYQYYEFQAVDRPLTDAEMKALRAVSSRAEITRTRFVNTYSYGDFKGEPASWVERCFDAFLYLANWGTRELMLRLPVRVLGAELARRYCPGDEASAEVRGEFVVLALTSREEEGDDYPDDGSGWLASIIPVRAEIASGDHRALYLAWLMWAQWGEGVDEEAEEPPVPPGLRKLSAAQRAFADFLRIDPDLIRAAAERSTTPSMDPEALRGWIGAFPPEETAALLARVALGEGAPVAAELQRRFREAHSDGDEALPRTVGELLRAADARTAERVRREDERAAREKARREREEAAARERHLVELAAREAEAWREVDEFVAEKKAPAYDHAVRLLRDLIEVAERQGHGPEADARVQALREQHRSKRSFVQRLDSLRKH
jgi:hypothetical protein